MGDDDGRETATVCAPGRIRRLRATDASGASNGRDTSAEEVKEEGRDEDQVSFVFDDDQEKEGRTIEEGQS